MSEVNDDIKNGMLRGLVASMTMVNDFQRGDVSDEWYFYQKDDQTLVTPADIASDRYGKQILHKIPGVLFHGEESGISGSHETGITVYLDGLDGSMPFAIGARTSTVIVSATDKVGKVVYCLVGDPSNGRIWRAGTDQPTEAGVSLTFPIWKKEEWVRNTETHWAKCEVKDTELSGKTRVLIDSYPGFTRGGRVILSIEELNSLHSKIQAVSGLMMLGSNGMHHALVANGAKSQPAAITTAIGGPWDVAPVLLVISAGGEARAFHVTDDGKFEERDPLMIASYDIVVSGNRRAVDTLSEMILSLRS